MLNSVNIWLNGYILSFFFVNWKFYPMGNLLKCLLGISTINGLANIFHTQLINKFKRKRGGKSERVYFIIEM